MSWHFSRVMVAAYSAANCTEIGTSSEPSNLTTTRGACSWRDRMTAALNHFRSGMTSLHLTGTHGADWWTGYLADFRALESAQSATTNDLGKPSDSMTPKADCGVTNCESFARLNLGRWEWKTIPISRKEGSKPSCLTLPRWGSMRNGELFRREMPELATNANASGLKLPTPTAHCRKESGYPGEHRRKSPPLGAVFGGKPNPEYLEWMMGWPIGWTDLKALETDRFQQWLDSHGKLSVTENNPE